MFYSFKVFIPPVLFVYFISLVGWLYLSFCFNDAGRLKRTDEGRVSLGFTAATLAGDLRLLQMFTDARVVN